MFVSIITVFGAQRRELSLDLLLVFLSRGIINLRAPSLCHKILQLALIIWMKCVDGVGIMLYNRYIVNPKIIFKEGKF